MAGRAVRRDAAFGRRLKLAMTQASVQAKDLAVTLKVGRGTVSRWRKGECPDPLRLAHIARALGVTERWLGTGEAPQYASGALEGPAKPRTASERGKSGRGGDLAEIAADPDYQPEGSGFEPQISDDEVLDLLLFNRQGFTRYLMTRFEQPVRLPMTARLGFLNYLEGLARERGKSLPADHLDHLRSLIRSGGL